MAFDPDEVVLPLGKSCPQCGVQQRLPVIARDFARFAAGASPQECFPYLDDQDIERLVSGRCPDHADAAAPPLRVPASTMTLHRARAAALGNQPSSSPDQRPPPTEAELERRLRSPRATADAWRLAPADPGCLLALPPPERAYTSIEWRLISQGLIPSVMEDRWFIYADGMTIHAHRSWTGVEIYRFHFQRFRDSYSLASIAVLDDRQTYRPSHDLASVTGRHAEAALAVEILEAELEL